MLIIRNICLSDEKQGFDPLTADFDGADAVEDADDELDIVEGQGKAVRRKLLIQVDCSET